MSITLTVAEIHSLAMFAGLLTEKPDEDDGYTEITIEECPKEGLPDDDGKITHFAHIAYCTDCPEEGAAPLGPEIKP